MKARIKPSVPMADQAAAILRKRLRQDFSDGGRLPGENVIASELGISRGTVRQALAILEREGVIFRQQGAGTFANPHVLGITTRVDMAYEFSELIESAGFEASIETLEVKREPASADTARRLGLKPEAALLTARKVFLANRQPAIYVIENVPISLIQEEGDDADLAHPIFQFFDQRCHVQVDYILSEIIPSVAGGDLLSLLAVESGQAVLQFVEVFYSPGNKPLGQATVFYRDPVVRFYALRKMSRAP